MRSIEPESDQVQLSSRKIIQQLQQGGSSLFMAYYYANEHRVSREVEYIRSSGISIWESTPTSFPISKSVWPSLAEDRASESVSVTRDHQGTGVVDQLRARVSKLEEEVRELQEEIFELRTYILGNDETIQLPREEIWIEAHQGFIASHPGESVAIDLRSGEVIGHGPNAVDIELMADKERGTRGAENVFTFYTSATQVMR